MNENEAGNPSATTPGAGAIPEQTKSIRGSDTSFIDHQPDNQVVLSDRLEHLIRRVGGCQTDEVRALVRRIRGAVAAEVLIA